MIALVCLIIVIVLLIRKNRKHNKKNKKLLSSWPVPSPECISDCQHFNNNSPLCTQMCTQGITGIAPQKYMTKCVNSGISYDDCYYYLTFGDDDCAMYCYLIGCGNPGDCFGKCASF